MIMKRLFFLGFIALIAGAACTETVEIPVEQEPVGDRVVTIRASIGAETKTAYEDEKYFSWVAGDKITVWAKDSGGHYTDITFSTEAGGRSAEFTGTIPEGYELSGLALYPCKETGEFRCDDPLEEVVFLSQIIAPSKDNPMASIPLIGRPKDAVAGSDSYDFNFTTATAILKMSFTGMSTYGYDGLYIRLSAESLFGSFPVVNNALYMDESGDLAGGSRDIYVGDVVEGEDRDFYLPIPVGYIQAGAKIRVYASSGRSYGSILFEKEFKKGFDVERNRLTVLPTIAFPEWESLGEGKLYDGVLAKKTVDVEVQKSKSNDKMFRLVDPWNAMYGSTDGDEYYYFLVDNNGLVQSPKSALGHEGLFVQAVNTAKRTRVIDYGTEGLPKHVQFAGYFFNEDYSTYYGFQEEDMAMQFAFPGEDIVDVATGFEILSQDGSTQEQGVFNVSMSAGSYISMVRMAVAESETDALELIASDDENVVTVEFEGALDEELFELNLPAGAGSGKYCAVAEYLIGGTDWRVVSQKFNYEQPGVDAGFTIDDIVGNYTVSSVKSNFVPGRFPVAETVEETSTMTIEASDDPSKGNIMITLFLGIECDVEPIYGTLNTRTGLVELRAARGQYPFSVYSRGEGYQPYDRTLTYISKDFDWADDEPVEFILEDKGRLNAYIESDKWLCIMWNGNMFERAYLSISATRQ